MSTPDERLHRLLGGPELAVVRQRLRRQFERIESDTPLVSVRLGRLDPATHRALCQLSGKPSRLSRSMILDLPDLDARLRNAGVADSLRDALERLDGPIVSLVGSRRELQSRWAATAKTPGLGPRLRAWLDESPAAPGLLKRLGRDPERAKALLVAADAVLERLPVAGMPRSQLAAETLGDAHALDTGKSAAALVLAGWRWHESAAAGQSRAVSGQAWAEQAASEDADAAIERPRDVWARAGVAVSELARPVLFLNLPAPFGGQCAWIAGEPSYLSLRQLLRDRPAWPVAGRSIHVCENPDIVAVAADRLGAACAPLVCTDGMPAAAQRVLLGQLVSAGARLRYHGDYDWPGIGIGNFVIRTWRAAPWRFSAVDYRVAVAQAPSRPRNLAGGMVEAQWDAELTAAMSEWGLAIAEEAVVGQLLDDLRLDVDR
ncbi:TIGR02679 family protein [Lysobacter enzymogenes]|uniref:TIGR02679 family protein n=1 Tax=Lysobacter enzymogenes TaxID=69 RepID=A0A3N2RKM3_LYSEN|nr:TIGR02679 family protein [Lysobacter enzymogenes]ROU08022.1 TIGR02679 family protein [Lysobacter enzymogenes]